MSDVQDALFAIIPNNTHPSDILPFQCHNHQVIAVK